MSESKAKMSCIVRCDNSDYGCPWYRDPDPKPEYCAHPLGKADSMLSRAQCPLVLSGGVVVIRSNKWIDPGMFESLGETRTVTVCNPFSPK